MNLFRLFQPPSNVFGGSGFTMHDFIHDLAKFVSGDLCVRPEGNNSLNITRGLHISGLEKIKSAEDALEASMWEKKYLTKLVYDWAWRSHTNDSQKDQQVLDNLRPHTNLEKVEVKNYLGTHFPAWFEDPCFSNLVSVELEDCANCYVLPALDQLPALEKIVIVGVDIESFSKAKCPRFLKLVDLGLHNCPNLVCFPDGGLHAPNLVSLMICGCEKLKSLAKHMHTLPSLKSFCIFGCPELESFPRKGLP